MEPEAEPRKVTELADSDQRRPGSRGLPTHGAVPPGTPLFPAPLTWPCCPPTPLTLTLAARVSSLSMSRSSSTSISSSGISSSWGRGGGGGRDKGLSWERGCERGSLAEAPALLQMSQPSCPADSGSCSEEKTDQACAKANCPMRGGASCPCQLGTLGARQLRLGILGWEPCRCVSPTSGPPISTRAQVGPAVPTHHSPFPSPKHLSQLPRSEEEVKGEGSVGRTQAW